MFSKRSMKSARFAADPQGFQSSSAAAKSPKLRMIRLPSAVMLTAETVAARVAVAAVAPRVEVMVARLSPAWEKSVIGSSTPVVLCSQLLDVKTNPSVLTYRINR